MEDMASYGSDQCEVYASRILNPCSMTAMHPFAEHGRLAARASMTDWLRGYDPHLVQRRAQTTFQAQSSMYPPPTYHGTPKGPYKVYSSFFIGHVSTILFSAWPRTDPRSCSVLAHPTWCGAYDC